MESKNNEKEEIKQNAFIRLSEKLGEISPMTRMEFDAPIKEEKEQEKQDEKEQDEKEQEAPQNDDSAFQTDDEKIYAMLTGKANVAKTEDETVLEEDTENLDDKHDETANIGIKAAGITAICLAVLGLAVICVMLYFLVINPDYLKTGTDKNFDIPYVTTGTDGIDMSDVVLLQTPSDINFDEINDNVADIDANASYNTTVITTPTDATPSDDSTDRYIN